MLTLPEDLLRIVYFSRNNITGSSDEMVWEIDRILDISQANNGFVGVTGALIFNDGVFGQVLEGPRAAVEETFERIQLDDRHFDVTLLDISAITARSFADWSMGFVGSGGLQEVYTGVTSIADFDISLLSGEEIYGVLHALTLKNELRARAA